MGNFEDFTHKLLFQFIFRHTRELRHIIEVHLRFFSHRKREGFHSCLHALHRLRRTDRALCENIRLLYKFILVYFLFQPCNKVIRNILIEIAFVGLAVDKPILIIEVIIGLSEFCLQISDNAVRLVKLLSLNKLTGNTPQLDKSLVSAELCVFLVKPLLKGNSVFLEIDSIVLHKETEITQIRRYLHRKPLFGLSINVTGFVMTDLRRQLADCFVQSRFQVKTVLSNDHCA